VDVGIVALAEPYGDATADGEPPLMPMAVYVEDPGSHAR